MIEIRHAKPGELRSIFHVHQGAFGRPNEAQLVEQLHAANKALVSLVAAHSGQVVGHLLFSPVTLHPPCADCRALGLGPIGVIREYQKQGIGARLIREGLQICRDAEYDAVVVLGNPAYYSRFGFRRASDFGLGNEYGAADTFMALELGDGRLAGVTTTVRYSPEFQATGC